MWVLRVISLLRRDCHECSPLFWVYGTSLLLSGRGLMALPALAYAHSLESRHHHCVDGALDRSPASSLLMVLSLIRMRHRLPSVSATKRLRSNHWEHMSTFAGGSALMARSRSGLVSATTHLLLAATYFLNLRMSTSEMGAMCLIPLLAAFIRMRAALGCRYG